MPPVLPADAKGQIWIGTRQHGLHCWHDGKFVEWGDASVLRGQTLHTLLASKSGDLWMGQESPNAILRLRDGHITTFPIEATVRIIRAMVEDAAGNIWVGTSKGNLLRINGEKIIEESPRRRRNSSPSAVSSRRPMAYCGLAMPAPASVG